MPMFDPPWQTPTHPYVITYDGGCSVIVGYTKNQYDNAANKVKDINATIRRLGQHGN